MAAITGYGGHIDVDGTYIPCVRDWSVTPKADTKEGSCSSSDGAKFRKGGNVDFSGTYSAYGHTPAILPGATGTFNGAQVGDAGAAIGVSGDIIADSFTVDIDIEGGEIISHSVNFSGNGTLTHGGVTVDTDVGVADPQSAAGLKVEVASDPFFSFVQIPDVRSVSLTVSRENKSYVSSSTAFTTTRSIGTLDATVSIPVYAQAADGIASFPLPNGVRALRIYVDATTFYLVRFLVFSEASDYKIPREASEFVACTLNAGFTGYTDVSATATKGTILLPSTDELWP